MVVGRRRVIPLALVVLSVSVLTRAFGLHWWVLAARGDGLALGGLLAALRPECEYMAKRQRALTSGLTACAALGGLVALAITSGLKFQGRLPYPAPSALILAVNLLWSGLVGLAVCHSGHPALWLLRGRSLRSVGVMSYGLYLYHYVVLLITDDIAQKLGTHGRPLWREAIGVAVCFALAALSWHYIERPILALKHRVPYRSVPIPSETLIAGRRNSTVEQS